MAEPGTFTGAAAGRGAQDAVGWAVVGTGTMPAGMAAAIAGLDVATLAAVVSRDPDAGPAFADRHGAPAVYGDLAPALADERVEAVYIGSPNALHFEQAMQAVAAGRHVLCDKPMTTDPEEARALRDRAAEGRVVLSVNLQNRHNPAALLARGWLRDGAIGRPITASVTIGFGPEELTGWRADPRLAIAGALYNLGIHAIDTLLFLVGSTVRLVNAVAEPPDAVLDRTDLVTLRFDSGLLASVMVSQELVGDDVTLRIIGGSGEIQWDDWMTPYRGGRLVMRSGGRENVHEAACPDAYSRLVRSFCRAVRGLEEPEPSADAAVATVEVVEAARASKASGTSKTL